jgi:large subunit ribosomal protein L23
MNTTILIKPLITEKMQRITDKTKQYGFVVNRHSTKPEIIAALETMYDVKIEGISTMVYNGKVKTRNTKRGLITGKKSAFKKAIVTLQEGQEIDFYANI